MTAGLQSSRARETSSEFPAFHIKLLGRENFQMSKPPLTLPPNRKEGSVAPGSPVPWCHAGVE